MADGSWTAIERQPEHRHELIVDRLMEPADAQDDRFTRILSNDNSYDCARSTRNASGAVLSRSGENVRSGGSHGPTPGVDRNSSAPGATMRCETTPRDARTFRGFEREAQARAKEAWIGEIVVMRVAAAVIERERPA